MLIRAEISNYKSIASADLDFSSENIIVGPNGVGKSNLLDAIHFIRDAASDGLDQAVTKRHGITSIRRWSKTRPFNISIKLHFKDGQEYGDYKVVIASGGGDFSVIEEEGMWYGAPPIFVEEDRDNFIKCSFKRKLNGGTEFNLPKNPLASIGRKISVSPSDMIVTQFGGSFLSEYALFFGKLHEVLVSCGAYSIYPNKIREPQAISNLEVLSDDGTNLASIIRQMRASNWRVNKENLTSALRQVLPILNEIRIGSAGGFYVPIFRVKEGESIAPHDLNMSQISDGTLRMLGMLTAFYQPKAPSRITIEEPEQMIHPGLLPILVDASRDYLEGSVSRRQVFITTHSPTLLDMYDPDSIIGCSFKDGVSTLSKMSDRQMEMLKSNLFSAGELLLAEGFVQ